MGSSKASASCTTFCRVRRTRSFISCAALLVKVSPSMRLKTLGSSGCDRAADPYSTANLKVLPAPAEALYTAIRAESETVPAIDAKVNAGSQA